MRIKYDGKLYQGTAREIVGQMNADTFRTRDTINEYMWQYSRREFLWDGEGVRVKDVKKFLIDLEAKGLLKIL